ncbi:MAG TPA: IS3 family transposase [Thermoanaerobaculia bacterium]|nr:IS3 family transposase [Thermoanaerobaculia bacterium]
MAQERKRRRFTAEYKAEAVKRLEESGKALQQVAADLGVHANQLRTWRNERLAAGSADALARQKAEAAELARLKRENKRLEQENEILKRAAAFFARGGPVVRYRFVAAERATFPVRMLCRLVGVAASGFYAWLRRGPGRRAGEDAGLAGRIAAIFEASRRTYGSPRIHAELREDGVRTGRGRVARLMRRGGLTAARRRRVPRTTDSRHDHPVAPNLLGRNFAADRPDTVWLADISYIPTGEGWMYLAAVKDMATREIAGWSMADHLRGELARDALVMAIQRRQPPRGLIQHSDRGVQYASKPYRAILARHGITPSMSRKGDCLDNAPMESFFGSLKNELVHRTTFPTREAARRAIFEYVEAFYNRRRRHSGLGFLTPAQAYEQMARAA